MPGCQKRRGGNGQRVVKYRRVRLARQLPPFPISAAIESAPRRGSVHKDDRKGWGSPAPAPANPRPDGPSSLDCQLPADSAAQLS